ncbi:MAG: substrate-binding domain-containing protein, partial [Rhodospirillales bacterium]|nr:substrate-binding domain-containing protein [Rhodospirillales bacterium]
GYRAVMNVGGQFSLWDRLLLRWIPWMRSAMPDIAIRAEVGLSDGLMRQLAEGMIDIGVMYNPLSRPGLVIEKLLEERLVMVSTKAREITHWDDNYVFVDWGPEFRSAHSQAYPEITRAGVSVGLGALGLQHILANGGTGYFPMRVVRGYLGESRLFAVAGAAEFRRPAFVVFSSGEEQPDWLKTALQGLRYVASLENED